MSSHEFTFDNFRDAAQPDVQNIEERVRKSFWYPRLAITEEGYRRDAIGKPGIAMTIGPPLEKRVLDYIQARGKNFEDDLDSVGLSNKVQINWRFLDEDGAVITEGLKALHIPVHGLYPPTADLDVETMWSSVRQRSQEIEAVVRKCVRSRSGFDLALGGIGILGSGAIAMGISDSLEIQRVRNELMHLKDKWGAPGGQVEGINQIALGRIRLPEGDLSQQELDALKRVAVQHPDLLVTRVKSFKLVCYGHEFLSDIKPPKKNIRFA
jgi:hypothetical protein